MSFNKNQEYRNFMLDIMLNLEPVQYSKGTIIINELDEVNEVIFIEKG